MEASEGKAVMEAQAVELGREAGSEAAMVVEGLEAVTAVEKAVAVKAVVVKGVADLEAVWVAVMAAVVREVAKGVEEMAVATEVAGRAAAKAAVAWAEEGTVGA